MPTPTILMRARVPGRPLQVACGDMPLARDQWVVADIAGKHHFGAVVAPPEDNAGSPDIVGVVLRTATEDDTERHRRNLEREAEALVYGREQIRSLELPMKLAGVEWEHRGRQITFFFSSPERVDFRPLLKGLANRYRVRIELRQLGVRDAARWSDGIGSCGRQLCCSTWLPEFQPVSIRMGKDQGLSMNHDKLAGACGRLRCCLRYEQDQYREARRTLPKAGKAVRTPRGNGRVRDLAVLARRVTVQLDEGGTVTFAADEVEPLNKG